MVMVMVVGEWVGRCGMLRLDSAGGPHWPRILGPCVASDICPARRLTSSRPHAFTLFQPAIKPALRLARASSPWIFHDVAIVLGAPAIGNASERCDPPPPASRLE